MSAPAPKTCLGCGRDWTPKRSDAKTCSAACRQRMRRRLRPKSNRTVYLDDVPLHDAETWLPEEANPEEPFTSTGRVRDSGRKAEGKQLRLDSARPPKGTRLSGSDKAALCRVDALIAATSKTPPTVQTVPGGQGFVGERSVTIRESALPTMAERVTDHEKRLLEVERQLGLPAGGSEAAEQAVDRFLDSVNKPRG
jgi:hypothetical protein